MTPIACDTGAAGDCFSITANAIIKRPCSAPIHILSAGNMKLQSTHAAEPNTPELQVLPPAARETHLFPQTQDASLSSIGQLCDHGCEETFSKSQVCIKCNNKVILTGTRSADTNCHWCLDNDPVRAPTLQALNAINQLASPADLIAFARAALYSPALRTLKHEFRKGCIKNFPGSSLKMLSKHSPVTAATAKGHLNRVRKNRRSAEKNNRVTAKEEEDDYFPSQATPTGNDTDFAYPFTFKATGKSCSDQSGKFPVTTADRNTQLFVLHHHDSNCVFLEPMKNKSKEQMRLLNSKFPEPNFFSRNF